MDKKLNKKNTETSPNRTARIAGFLYLLLVPLGFFGTMYIPSIIVSRDAVATVNNIMAHTLLFRLNILSALITPIVTVLVALFLYKLLKPVNRYYPVYIYRGIIIPLVAFV